MAPDTDDDRHDEGDRTEVPEVDLDQQRRAGLKARWSGSAISGSVYRARAADHRKPTDYVQLKLRVRASLVKRLQKEADKKKQSANNEAVERLERTFAGEAQASRDTETLNLMLGLVAKDANMKHVFADIIHELAKVDFHAIDAEDFGRGLRWLIAHAATAAAPWRDDTQASDPKRISAPEGGI
jgi:hypothetical protein